MIYGFPGADSCADWTAERAGKRQGLQGWLLGWVSGQNVFGQNNGDVSNGASAEGLLGWMDNYCKANPLDSMATAAMKLSKELEARSSRSRRPQP